MIWVINNIKFGYKNNDEYSNIVDSFFDNCFIPFLKKYAKNNDIVVHLGNLFNATESINVSVLLKAIEIFDKITQILPLYIIRGSNEKNGILKIFENKNNIFIIDDVKIINNCLFIPFDKDPVKYIINYNNSNNNNVEIVFIADSDNSHHQTDILKNFKNILFVCGGENEDKKNEENCIYVSIPYLQSKKSSANKGFYIIDTKSKKYKFIKNKYTPDYKKIVITDIAQLSEIDADYVNKNFVDVVVDRSLVDGNKIKIDFLLSKFNFRSITYINEDDKNKKDNNNNGNLQQNDVSLIPEDSLSINIEKLIKDRIKDNPELLLEFENIMRIFKERYKKNAKLD